MVSRIAVIVMLFLILALSFLVIENDVLGETSAISKSINELFYDWVSPNENLTLEDVVKNGGGSSG